MQLESKLAMLPDEVFAKIIQEMAPTQNALCLVAPLALTCKLLRSCLDKAARAAAIFPCGELVVELDLQRPDDTGFALPASVDLYLCQHDTAARGLHRQHCETRERLLAHSRRRLIPQLFGPPLPAINSRCAKALLSQSFRLMVSVIAYLRFRITGKYFRSVRVHGLLLPVLTARPSDHPRSPTIRRWLNFVEVVVLAAFERGHLKGCDITLSADSSGQTVVEAWSINVNQRGPEGTGTFFTLRRTHPRGSREVAFIDTPDYELSFEAVRGHVYSLVEWLVYLTDEAAAASAGGNGQASSQLWLGMTARFKDVTRDGQCVRCARKSLPAFVHEAERRFGEPGSWPADPMTRRQGCSQCMHCVIEHPGCETNVPGAQQRRLAPNPLPLAFPIPASERERFADPRGHGESPGGYVQTFGFDVRDRNNGRYGSLGVCAARSSYESATGGRSADTEVEITRCDVMNLALQ